MVSLNNSIMTENGFFSCANATATPLQPAAATNQRKYK
jgi:hypothetical protein